MIRFLCVRSFIILSQFFLFVKNFFIYFVVLSFSALQQLLYNIISDLICQELFNFSFRSDLYCSDRSPSATFIDYHIWSLVSRSFFHSFQSQKTNLMLYFPAALSATLTILPQLYTVCQQLFYVFSTIIFAIHILCFSLSKLQYMDGIFHFIIDTLYLWFPKFKYVLYFSFMISKNPAF